MEAEQEAIVEMLAELVRRDPSILRSFPVGLPNVAMPTMGGALFWEDVAEIKGWRIQQNVFTDHWRLLDPGNMRHAWGTDRNMVDIFVRAARNGDTEADMSDGQEGSGGEDGVSPDAVPSDDGEEICLEETSLGT
jgi:hypothetical protein